MLKSRPAFFGIRPGCIAATSAFPGRPLTKATTTNYFELSGTDFSLRVNTLRNHRLKSVPLSKLYAPCASFCART